MVGCSKVNPTKTPYSCLKSGIGMGLHLKDDKKKKKVRKLRPKIKKDLKLLKKKIKKKRSLRSRKYTRAQLLELPPQARGSTLNLSLIAKRLKVRVTKANGTRKTKAMLITDILAAQG